MHRFTEQVEFRTSCCFCACAQQSGRTVGSLHHFALLNARAESTSVHVHNASVLNRCAHGETAPEGLALWTMTSVLVVYGVLTMLLLEPYIFLITSGEHPPAMSLQTETPVGKDTHALASQSHQEYNLELVSQRQPLERISLHSLELKGPIIASLIRL